MIRRRDPNQTKITASGRVLWLTSDLSLIENQLRGVDLPFDEERELLDNVSTDELIPAWACYYYDETIARYCLTGLRGGVVRADEVAAGGVEVIVSGRSKGSGSSREQAPLSEFMAGVRVVFARSFEKICAQNALNIGMLLSTDFSLLERMMAGESVPRGALAFGVGAIDMALAWLTKSVRGRVPETVEIGLKGRLGPGLMAEDIAPHVLCSSWYRQGALVGKAVHWRGPGLVALSLDERAKVTLSAVNRNYPGRSGPGRVLLASPAVVAASAIAGRLVLPVRVSDPSEREPVPRTS